MSDETLETNGLSFDELVRRIDRFQARAEALEAENARLSERLADLEGTQAGARSVLRRSAPTADSDPCRPVESTGDHHLSRRGALLALGGAAAAGAGMAAGVFGGAQPAAATQGNPVLLGEDNTDATARTGLFYNATPGGEGGTFVALLADGTDKYGVQGQDNSPNEGGIGVSGVSALGIAVK